MKKRITLLLVLLVSSMPAWSNTNDDATAAAAKKERAATEFKSKLKHKIAGEWGNSSIAIDLPAEPGKVLNMGLNYHFDANGQYSKTLIGNEINISEKGRWEISDNGKQLILFSSNRNYPELVSIKFLESDEMVLEQGLQYESVGIKLNPDTYFFNKR